MSRQTSCWSAILGPDSKCTEMSSGMICGFRKYGSARVSKSGEPSEPGSENNLLLRILGFFFKNEMLSDYKKTMPFWYQFNIAIYNLC